MMEGFCGKVKEALNDFGVNSEHLTKEKLVQVLDEFRADLKADVARIERSLKTVLSTVAVSMSPMATTTEVRLAVRGSTGT